MCSYSHRFDFMRLPQKEKKNPTYATPQLIKCTSRLNLLRVCYFAHGRRDTFQIVIKDCPKTTHAFSCVAAIPGSWHVSIFAQFFIHADRLMESVTPLHLRYVRASKNVVSRLPVDADLALNRCSSDCYGSYMPKDLSGRSTQTGLGK